MQVRAERQGQRSLEWHARGQKRGKRAHSAKDVHSAQGCDMVSSPPAVTRLTNASPVYAGNTQNSSTFLTPQPFRTLSLSLSLSAIRSLKFHAAKRNRRLAFWAKAPSPTTFRVFQQRLDVLQHLGHSPVPRGRPGGFGVVLAPLAVTREAPDVLQQLPPALERERVVWTIPRSARPSTGGTGAIHRRSTLLRGAGTKEHSQSGRRGRRACDSEGRQAGTPVGGNNDMRAENRRDGRLQ